MKRLMVIFLLVLLPVPALAECAWVLWYTMTASYGQTPEPLEAFENRDGCVQRAEEMMREDEKHPNVTRIGPDMLMFEYGKGSWIATYRCLPDTLDPREKGG